MGTLVLYAVAVLTQVNSIFECFDRYDSVRVTAERIRRQGTSCRRWRRDCILRRIRIQVPRTSGGVELFQGGAGVPASGAGQLKIAQPGGLFIGYVVGV